MIGAVSLIKFLRRHGARALSCTLCAVAVCVANVAPVAAQQQTPEQTFEHHFDGEDGSDWPAQWRVTDSPAKVLINNNRGDVRYGRSNATTLATFVPPDQTLDPQVIDSDQRVLLRCTVASSGMSGGLIARRNSHLPHLYYRVTLDAQHIIGHTIRIARVTADDATVLAFRGKGYFWQTDRDHYLRVVVQQVDHQTTQIKAKVWAVEEPEPVAWSLEATDRYPALQRLPGSVGLYARTVVSFQRHWQFDDYTVTARFKPPTPVTFDPIKPTPVPASGVNCMLVDDQKGLLILGGRGSKDQPARLTLHHLNQQGDLTGEPVVVPLPRSEELPTAQQYPLSLALHPDKPLLYVWQDISADASKAHAQAFAHLLVYSMESDVPELIGSFASGKQFATGRNGGSIALHDHGAALLVPNVQNTFGRKGDEASIGLLTLDDAGLPVRNDAGDLELMVQDISAFAGKSTGWGFVSGSSQAVLFGAPTGPTTWSMNNHSAPLVRMSLPDAGERTLLAGHPTESMVYVSSLGGRGVYAMQHVQGYITMFPQQLALPGASLRSAPVVAAKKHQLMIGGAGAVHVLNLDASGALTGETAIQDVANENVRALAYSELFDRLYVPTEETP